MRRGWVQFRYGFDRHALRDRLVDLGLAPGQTVVVHSSFDSFEAFRGSAADVIAVLLDVLGPEGTLIMPTIPFTGSAVEYAASGPVFDVRRTPSQMGLLSEILRRNPNAVRSIHPTHSVAAVGRLAQQMTAGHSLARTPCGAGSPWHKLLDHQGKILLLGTGIRAMTFFHTCEEILEPVMPFSPFTREVYTLSSRDLNRELVTTSTRLFEPSLSRRRNLEPLQRELASRGLWHSIRIGTLDAVLLDAHEVLRTCQDMAARGYYCYDAE
jgi:aminoglycoside 3-N-acetyltransferase